MRKNVRKMSSVITQKALKNYLDIYALFSKTFFIMADVLLNFRGLN